MTIGPDLASPLHAVWPVIEVHAERLERLCLQQKGVTFTVTGTQEEPGLALTLPLAEPHRAMQVVVTAKEVHYYIQRDGQMYAVESMDHRIDRGVYLLLAELAAQE